MEQTSGSCLQPLLILYKEHLSDTRQQGGGKKHCTDVILAVAWKIRFCLTCFYIPQKDVLQNMSALRSAKTSALWVPALILLARIRV